MTPPDITFTEIKSVADPAYGRMERLLTDTFPTDEYRELGELRSYTENNAAFHCWLITAGVAEAGLINWWDFGTWRYVEHFAIWPAIRGSGIGAKAITRFTELADTPVVLEVELPGSNPMAQRRIGFYERAGFRMLDIPYVQPPYKEGSAALPMRLMVAGAGEPEAAGICSRLYREVYRHFTTSTPSITEM